MTTPVEESTNVGYCVPADVYCSFTEYYGNGTVYGWRHLYIGSEVVRGAGRTKRELIAAGAVQEEAICPAVPADVLVLPLDPVEQAEPVPIVAQPEAPVESEAAPVPVEKSNDVDSLKAVTVNFKGFKVSLKAKISSDVTVELLEDGTLSFVVA